MSFVDGQSDDPDWVCSRGFVPVTPCETITELGVDFLTDLSAPEFIRVDR